jgi:hypothetical protein
MRFCALTRSRNSSSSAYRFRCVSFRTRLFRPDAILQSNQPPRPDVAINATRRRAGAGPAPLQIGERGQVLPNSSAINSRRRFLQCRYRNNVSLRSSRTACPRRCFEAHADEQKRGPLARTSKAFRSGHWSAKRAAPAAERCSCAVLECGLSMRFAVTCQRQVVFTIVDKKPTTTTVVQVGPMAFKTRTEAEAGMKTITVCSSN